jgi:hypothetical protein
LEATVGQKNWLIDKGVASLEQNKNQMWLECDTHKNVRANRVKITETTMCAGVENCAKEQQKI